MSVSEEEYDSPAGSGYHDECSSDSDTESDYSDDESDHEHCDDGEDEILKFALGKRVCDNSSVNKGLDIILFAIIATIIFLILSSRWFERCLRRGIPDYNYRLFCKGVIFFLLIFILDLLFKKWRKSRVVFCK